ncbi:MAG TPA: peroxiredoxin [Microscillaceae bacterium]|nr:peroxiredoxin [Microscillaceae bacterium]
MTEAAISATIGEDNFKTIIQTSSHQLIADEPTDLGGQDLGATPFELLLSSLGACTAITLRMYANHKQLPLRRVEVHLSLVIEKDKEGKQRSIIHRKIEIDGDISEDLRQRMLKVANSCPVHKLLSHQIVIETTLSK